jgi:hypothetical protein
MYGDGVYVGGSVKAVYKYIFSDGERIRVTIDVFQGTIGWERTHPTYLFIGSLPILETIRQKQLYPYVDFR